jgi:NADH-quinone oxidoreductase subunit N
MNDLRALLEQLEPLLPVGVVLLASLLVVLLGLALEAKDRYVLGWAALAGCLLALGALGAAYFGLRASHHAPLPFFATLAAPVTSGYQPLRLGGAFALDGFGFVIALVALMGGACAVLTGAHEAEDSPLSSGEYYGLLLLAVAGMMLLGVAHDFTTLLVSLEIMSVATYVLAGARRDEARSGEAALKYLILGAFSTAFLLFGVAFLFGATGRLSLAPVTVPPSDPRFHLALAGLALILAGVLFKVGAVPFHFWLPDVYEGAPTPVTTLMAVGVKAAAFGATARIVFETFGARSFLASALPLLAAAAVVTMVLGNLVAMYQRNVKRMLAYSAIAHTGYLLLAFLVHPQNAGSAAYGEHLQAVAFYLLAYGLMTAGAFAVTALPREDGRPLERLEDYRGLAREHPALALCMAVFMLSLAGLPPFAGFFAKFLVFRGAIEQGFVLPAVLGILASVASLYYYLRVIREMYMAPEPAPPALPARIRPAWTASVLVYGAGALTLFLGLAPDVAAPMLGAPGPAPPQVTPVSRAADGEPRAGDPARQPARAAAPEGR